MFFLKIVHGIGFLKNTGRDIQSFVKRKQDTLFPLSVLGLGSLGR